MKHDKEYDAEIRARFTPFNQMTSGTIFNAIEAREHMKETPKPPTMPKPGSSKKEIKDFVIETANYQKNILSSFVDNFHDPKKKKEKPKKVIKMLVTMMGEAYDDSDLLAEVS